MEFRILGPIEVHDGPRRLELGGAKQRALLSILLLHAGEPVATDRLIDSLWGERPPASALNSVHIYVSRLRKALGDRRLVTRSGGYALEIEPDELDLRTFERLVAEGRELLAGGDADGARARLVAALALWRGSPLSELADSDYGRIEADRLEELRLAAREERIEADLRLGRDSEVVPELEALVRRQPLRERLRGQLMLALYRAGRQSEALDVYRQGYRLLSEELGLDPSHELQELERSILAQDPALARPTATPTRSVSSPRRAALLVASAAVVLLVAVVATVVRLSGGDTPGLASVAPDTIGVLDPETNRIVAQVPVAGGPARLAADDESVWVGSDDSGTVSSLDPRTHSITKLVALGGFPSDVDVGEGGVWVVDGRSGKLTKIDPVYSDVRARVVVTSPDSVYDVSRYSFDPTSVAAGAGRIWVTDGTPDLVRVDPRSVRVVGTTSLGLPLEGVTVADGAVWAISGASATVLRIDRKGRETLRIPIVSEPGFESPYPLAITAGEGYVWVLNGNTATVTKIDPEQRAVVATVPIGVGRGPAQVAAGLGAGWVANADGTLARIDAGTNDVTFIPVGRSLRDVTVASGLVWIVAGKGLGSPTSSSTSEGDDELQPLPTSSCSPIYYSGRGRPDYLIASDLPLQGQGMTTPQLSQAIHFVLRQHSFRAGRYGVGYQSCDDSTIAEGNFSTERCASNARAYAANQSVIGVIGPFNSQCAVAQIAVLNAAPEGSVPMVGFSNTYPGLTRAARGTNLGEPGVYYPSGIRNYVRLIATDDVQAAASAILAKQAGTHRVFVLEEAGANGTLLGGAFMRAANAVGVNVVGRGSVDAYLYEPRLGGPLVRAKPDAIFVASVFYPAIPRLIRQIRAALPGVRIMLPDAFSDFDQLVKVGGPAVEGVTISVAGAPIEQLPEPGRKLMASFGEEVGGRPGPFAALAAQATEVLLDAIAKSDGTRASVVEHLLETEVSGGILGSFSIDRNGDTTAGPVTIYRIERGAPTVLRVITPSPDLVR